MDACYLEIGDRRGCGSVLQPYVCLDEEVQLWAEFRLLNHEIQIQTRIDICRTYP